MNDDQPATHRHSTPWRTEPNSSDACLRFGMPATWEHCVKLGYDPLTGEPT